jgi:hypothetical protein
MLAAVQATTISCLPSNGCDAIALSDFWGPFLNVVSKPKCVER